MSTHQYNSAARRRNLSRSRAFSENVATERLQERVYFGVGMKYLGWKFPVYEDLADGTKKLTERARPSFWSTPPVKDRRKWNPIREHLQGAFRGLVWNGSSHIPFVTVEHDRHDATVLTKPHILQVVATGRLLTRCFSSAQGYRLNWCVEINPRNGSVKFFGWGDRPIPIEIAQKIGEQIQEAMRQKGILGSKDRREIFPYNHPQVMLPMRIDKTTIIDSGVVPKCTRKKRQYGLGYEDPRLYKLVPYETYSVLRFWQWLRRGGHYSEQALLETLKQACAALPDKVVPVEEPLIREDEGELPDSSDPKRPPMYTGEASDNPNSFERQHDALLVFCRQSKRVVSVNEALVYIRGNRLFTGAWENAKRPSRVKWILKRIAKTFDASKCHGVRYDVQIGKYDQWARHHVGTIKGRDRRSLDEYGEVSIQENRYQIDWQFASAFLSVVEYCLVTSPNDDGSLPHVRAKEIWDRCYEGGQITIPFCDRKWKICRDWLERRGVLKVTDRAWHRGKAMRWEVKAEFHRLPQWWKREKKPSLLEAVSLEKFLKEGMDQQQGLNSYSYNEVDRFMNQPDCSSVLIRPPP
jgi:hypothetical protein